KALLRSTKQSTPLPPVPSEKNQHESIEENKGLSARTNPEPTYRPVDPSTTRPIDETTIRPDGVPSGRREFIRRGFEWYADQLRALKKLSLEEQMEGKPGNMSQMVRDALDDYLKKKTTK
ncbi:MAG: hypothetical protein LC674_06000, partial [Actinobacteria bacterium]|nr:hypothetical protein [Actinomycetota bacterium]